MPIRGGNWNNGANAGLFALNLNNLRSNTNSNIGFRPALLYRQMQGSQESLAGTGRKGNPSPFLCRACRGGQEEDLSAWAVSKPGKSQAQNGPGSSICKQESLGRYSAYMPHTHGSLWDTITAWDNIYAGYCEARNGKRYRQDVLEFGSRLEEYLIEIQNHLIWKTWSPARWNEFYIYDPKKRLIQAPRFKDRVVHHALVRVIEPLFERKFIHDSYACRRDKGTHKAVDRLQAFLRRAKRLWGKVYVLKADIAAYFPSIVHERLLLILSRTIRDKNTLWLCRTIIQECGHKGRGLPVGALTSQLFANVYMDQLDHLVKDGLGVRFYLRFMDDWVILAPSKAVLSEILAVTKEFLLVDLGLALNPKTRIFPAHQGVDFAGYRTWATHRLPRKRNVLRARRRFRALAQSYSRGEIGLSDVRPSVASFLGYMKHCSSFRTVQGILDDFVLKRNGGVHIETNEDDPL